ncbi:MAG: class I SAM-dependent methyltransferase [Candidatus Wallbacteria bacterium]
MSWDPIWEKVFYEQEWGKYPPECLIRFVARNFYKKDRKNVKILEVGCGTGANIWYISREGFDTYGIDASKTAIEKAEKRLKAESLNAHIILGDIEKLPYEDNFFDAVVDNGCLCCNSEEATIKIIKEIKRVLKISGLFFSKTFTEKMYIGKKQNKISELEFDEIDDGPLYNKGFIRLVDEDSIKKIYGKIFKILSVDKLTQTINNREIIIDDWIIISQK